MAGGREVWRAHPLARRYSAMAEQASLLRQQDETLATLGQGVQRVKALAGVMNEELSEQAVILDSLDDDVNKTDSAMHTMNRKLKTLVADAKSRTARSGRSSAASSSRSSSSRRWCSQTTRRRLCGD